MNRNKKLYFVGIAGTGMGSVAGLAQEAGYQVMGSDHAIYPPISTMLEGLKIPVFSPYSKENIQNHPADTYIIGNAISKNHPEAEAILASEASYKSFPSFLGEEILHNRNSVVITGTHGKTTTSSLTAHVLKELGEDPGFLIGGLPKGFSKSFHIGTGSCFVIEGDEYDTAFFDKESKFLHYRASICVINNIEFDHADIFKDLEAIYKMFEKLITQVKDPKNIVANMDDKGVAELITRMGLETKITATSPANRHQSAGIRLLETSVEGHQWFGTYTTPVWGTIKLQSPIIGSFNLANLAQILGVICRLVATSHIPKPSVEALQKALLSFGGIKRRMELLGSKKQALIYEDFAHHPTAVKEVINCMRVKHPESRLLVAFEPKNATSRRNIFQEAYSQVFKSADLVFIGPCPTDQRVVENQRMDIEAMAKGIGAHARSFVSNDDLLQSLDAQLKANDVVVFMSSGGFSGIQHKILSC